MAPAKKGKKKQQTLDNVVRKWKRLKEFSCNDVLCAVAWFVVCDDQVHSQIQMGWECAEGGQSLLQSQIRLPFKTVWLP